ncbi:MAG TPA: two-component regulator propeller domain-containing protein [Acidobacteriaceae bacterium]|nr:two-component regulator propeller domain-containing protein [Acidobacteriaceae bacterium]
MRRLGSLGWCMVVMLLVSIDARAVQQQAPDYFHHQVGSTEDGLPQATVNALLQSHQGYLWIATEDGAARFDGQSFRVLNHLTIPAFASDDVSCLAEDHEGDVWFGTSDGLVRKHGESYRRFSERDGLPSNEVVALATDSSDLLVLTTGGVAVWRRDHFERIGTNAVINGITATPEGVVLVSKKGDVYRWNQGRLIAVASAAEGQPVVLGAAISDRQAVWTFGLDFVQFSSASQKRIWRTGVELPGNRVQALHVDRQGKAWIGTNRGLVSIEPSAGYALRDFDVVRGESVLSVCVDREGDVWVGTEASGLHALQPRKFAILPGSTSEAVTTVVRDSRGVMYFGTRDDGIFRTDGAAEPVDPKKLTSPVILSLAAGPEGDVWAGTPDGLNHIVGTEVHHWTIAEGLPDNFVRSVLVAADKTVWAGTRFGLVHIDGKGAQTFTTADGLSSNSIGPLLEVRSDEAGVSELWIGTSAGLCRWTTRKLECLSSAYQANGSIITALAADGEGDVWVALHGHGLGVVKEDRVVSVSSSAIPTEIVGMITDDLGYLWLRSARGLHRIKISDLRACVLNPSACSSLKVDAYGRSDGMQSDELAGEGIPSAAKGSNGEIWFATRRGIAVTDAKHLLTNGVPPGVVITQAHVDGVELPVGASAEISPGHRQYSFEYNALSLNNPAGTHCRYMLDGFDRGWVDAGTRRAAYYTNLPARQYTFKVLCANSDGVWSKDEANFRFRVLMPWYRSVWAYLLGLCLAALTVFAFVQLRVRAERRRFDLVLQERTRVAREVHDTLAQDLVSVSLQVELAAQHAKAGRLVEVTEQLTRTRLLVRQALESARQSIWNLRANLSEESLPARLSARVEALRETNVTSHLRISGEYRSAAEATEKEILRIATEAISNAERHSGATEIRVDLAYGAESLRLQIRDNGCGFDYTSAREMADHFGLRGLEERAALLQGHLTVESAVGQGATVTLIVPLPTERA